MTSNEELRDIPLKSDFRFDGYRVELASRRLVSPENEEIFLRPKAFDVLIYLLRSAGRVISKDELLDRLWPETTVEESAVPHCIWEIREALGDHADEPRYIRTIPKKGYRLIAPVSTESETVAVRYREVRKIGRGGMGEVYLFEDTLLERNVAMKFPVAGTEQDEKVQKRLQREARAAAALDHPYICKIYDTGVWEGRTFIAMEYVEGETLKEKLVSGPIPLPEALRIAVETADALETAFDREIVHRDIKPSNIMLTPQGHVKVTDFGLAKRLHPKEGQEQDWTATLTADVTVRGTLPYMSPEQLRAGKVDHRSDIFSLGVVLYEMLTGVNPFHREAEAETTSAILTEEPRELTGELPGIPPLLQHTVKKMLAKKTDRRYQLVHEVRTDLSEIVKGLDNSSEEVTGGSTLPPSVSSAQLVWRVLPWVTAVIMMLVTVAVLWSVWSGSVQPPQTRFPVSIPGESGIPNVAGFPLAVSPDGKHLAYLAGQFGQAQLYLRAFDQLESRLLVDMEGVDAPFFSPDGEWLGFFTRTALYKIRVRGGSPMKICDLGDAQNRGASWAPDNVILFSQLNLTLWRVSANSGTAEKVADQCRWPQVLPDGEHVLCSEVGRSVIWSRVTAERHILEVGGAGARYIPSGHLVYGSLGSLLAVPFDLSRFEVLGSPEPVVEDVRMNPYDLAYFAVSDSGTLVYVAGRFETELMEVDRKGQALELLREPTQFLWPQFAPDGKRLSVYKQGTVAGIWVHELERETGMKIGRGYNPIWTPDGKQITFAGFDLDGIYSKSADGVGKAELLWEEWGRPLSWSPDGQTLAFQKRTDETGADIWVYHKGGEAEPLLDSGFGEAAARFSPEGRWLAYNSNESGQSEVYVQPFPGRGRRWPISVDGGSKPRWSADGRELFYTRNKHEVFVVSVKTEPIFSAGKPQLLFKRQSDWGWDVFPDGQRFVFVQEPEEPAQINVVLNWTEELKRLVPTDN